MPFTYRCAWCEREATVLNAQLEDGMVACAECGEMCHVSFSTQEGHEDSSHRTVDVQPDEIQPVNDRISPPNQKRKTLSIVIAVVAAVCGPVLVAVLVFWMTGLSGIFFNEDPQPRSDRTRFGDKEPVIEIFKLTTKTYKGALKVGIHKIKFDAKKIYLVEANEKDGGVDVQMQPSELLPAALNLNSFRALHHATATGTETLFVRPEIGHFDQKQTQNYTLTVRPIFWKKQLLFDREDALLKTDPPFEPFAPYHKRYVLKLAAGKYYLVELVPAKRLFSRGYNLMLLDAAGKHIRLNEHTSFGHETSNQDNKCVIYPRKSGAYTLLVIGGKGHLGEFRITMREKEKIGKATSFQGHTSLGFQTLKVASNELLILNVIGKGFEGKVHSIGGTLHYHNIDREGAAFFAPLKTTTVRLSITPSKFKSYKLADLDYSLIATSIPLAKKPLLMKKDMLTPQDPPFKDVILDLANHKRYSVKLIGDKYYIINMKLTSANLFAWERLILLDAKNRVIKSKKLVGKGSQLILHAPYTGMYHIIAGTRTSEATTFTLDVREQK